ncbi:fimbrial protein [Stenotrophomonas sp. PFBMAA-4]|uniref:fimbrial protein n=1 Tax=Stenotrophomonas sp. PFBMAA-4 TaxID=3043301 RepID=UPI0024B4FE4F|nr:fimbrial protein [Stenotrophomonas sp. PFBMAA-4]MDI9273898.1 fimbrial protein [Stenotrophomonas sp. PFBMAA-4]
MKAQPIILAVLMLAAVGQAHADSATIDVTGKVLPGTCTMANVPVTLADIDATDLKTGHDNGLKPAVLNFTGCVGVTSVDLTFDGAADAAQDGHWLNQAASGATGVAVALLEGATDDFLKKGDKKTVTINGAATGKLDMRTGYYRKAGTLLKAGDVSTQITVTAGYR